LMDWVREWIDSECIALEVYWRQGRIPL
jgi:hypothetical protein